MNASPWQLEPPHARFGTDLLRTCLDLAQARRGLQELQLGGRVLADANLLGMGWLGTTESETTSLAEAYVRGHELCVVYRAAAASLQIDAQWGVAGPGKDLLARFDLTVAVRTEQLQSTAELAVQSALPCQEVLRLVSTSERRFVVWDRDSASPWSVKAQDGPGCLVARLPASELSYVEMVLPAELGQSTLEWQGPRVKFEHRLFAEPLEKGVIRRARIRGGLVPRAQDLRLATQAFQALVAAEPPLGA